MKTWGGTDKRTNGKLDRRIKEKEKISKNKIILLDIRVSLLLLAMRKIAIFGPGFFRPTKKVFLKTDFLLFFLKI